MFRDEEDCVTTEEKAFEETSAGSKRKRQLGNDQPKKKAKTEPLLDEIYNEFNSEEDPTTEDDTDNSVEYISYCNSCQRQLLHKLSRALLNKNNKDPTYPNIEDDADEVEEDDTGGGESDEYISNCGSCQRQLLRKITRALLNKNNEDPLHTHGSVEDIYNCRSCQRQLLRKITRALLNKNNEDPLHTHKSDEYISNCGSCLRQLLLKETQALLNKSNKDPTHLHTVESFEDINCGTCKRQKETRAWLYKHLQGKMNELKKLTTGDKPAKQQKVAKESPKPKKSSNFSKAQESKSSKKSRRKTRLVKQLGNDQPKKKTKTKPLLDEIYNEFNSEEDPTTEDDTDVIETVCCERQKETQALLYKQLQGIKNEMKKPTKGDKPAKQQKVAKESPKTSVKLKKVNRQKKLAGFKAVSLSKT